MKNKKLLVALLSVFCAVSVSAFVGCETDKPGGDNPGIEQPDKVEVEKVVLSRTTASVKEGETVTVQATVLPNNATDKSVTWSSDKPEIATVKDGVITGVAAGTAKITAKAGSKTSECTVTVTPAQQPSDEVKVEGYIYHETFDGRTSIPNYFDINLEGGGSANVADGEMTFRTTGSGKTTAQIPLEGNFEHKVVAEARLKAISAKNFLNGIFFYNESGTGAVTLGMNNGEFRNHNGSGVWTEKVGDYIADTWYEVKMIMDFDTNKYRVIINGTDTGSEYSFRNAEAAKNITTLKIGTEQSDTGIVYDYIKIYNISAPEITVGEDSKDLDITDGPQSYDLDYTTDADVEITCDKLSGYSIADNKKTVTFTAAGTYVFTVTASSLGGTASETITVTVTGNLETPEITLTSAETATVSLFDDGGAKYTLSYTLTGSPAPDVELEYDDGAMFENHGEFTFIKAGTHTIKVKAVNSQGTDEKTVTVTVTDKYNVTASEDKTIWTEDFDGADKSTTEVKTGTGTIKYDNNSANLVTSASGDKSYVDKLFDAPLSGVFTVEMRFNNHTEPSFDPATGGVPSRFISLLFLTGKNTSSASTTNFGIEDHRLCYRDGAVSNWKAIQVNGYELGLVKDAWYTLRVVNDTAAKKSYVYLSGEKINLIENRAVVAPVAINGEMYVGEFDFRTPNQEIYGFRSGTDKVSVDFEIDDIKIYSLLPSLNVNEENKSFQLTGSSIAYALDYKASAGDTVKIVCDKTEGFTREGNNVTFTALGRYVFTVTVSNAYGEVSGTITVDVVDHQEAPVLTVTSDLTAKLTLEGGSAEYNLAYTATGSPEPDIEVTCDLTSGWTYEDNKITVTKAGVYTFTVKAVNAVGDDSETVTITVTEPATVTWHDSGSMNAESSDESLAARGGGRFQVRFGRIRL